MHKPGRERGGRGGTRAHVEVPLDEGAQPRGAAVASRWCASTHPAPPPTTPTLQRPIRTPRPRVPRFHCSRTHAHTPARANTALHVGVATDEALLREPTPPTGDRPTAGQPRREWASWGEGGGGLGKHKRARARSTGRHGSDGARAGAHERQPAGERARAGGGVCARSNSCRVIDVGVAYRGLGFLFADLLEGRSGDAGVLLALHRHRAGVEEVVPPRAAVVALVVGARPLAARPAPEPRGGGGAGGGGGCPRSRSRARASTGRRTGAGGGGGGGPSARPPPATARVHPPAHHHADVAGDEFARVRVLCGGDAARVRAKPRWGCVSAIRRHPPQKHNHTSQECAWHTRENKGGGGGAHVIRSACAVRDSGEGVVGCRLRRGMHTRRTHQRCPPRCAR